MNDIREYQKVKTHPKEQNTILLQEKWDKNDRNILANCLDNYIKLHRSGHFAGNIYLLRNMLHPVDHQRKELY